jgi:hypothetical protein
MPLNVNVLHSWNIYNCMNAEEIKAVLSLIHLFMRRSEAGDPHMCTQ